MEGNLNVQTPLFRSSLLRGCTPPNEFAEELQTLFDGQAQQAHEQARTRGYYPESPIPLN